MTASMTASEQLYANWLSSLTIAISFLMATTTSLGSLLMPVQGGSYWFLCIGSETHTQTNTETHTETHNPNP